MGVKSWPVVALLLVACAGKSEDSAATGGSGGGADGRSACDPLAAITTTAQLDASQVLAAGKSQDGTSYVVYNDNRLFVGSGKTLVERTVDGLGENGSQTDLSYTDDDGTAVVVEVVRADTGAHMTVARGKQSGKGIDSGNGEQLTLLDSDLLAALGTSTTQTFRVDYAASLSDGRELVVVAPVRATDYNQFRPFLGPPTALAEQTVTNFGSSKSGQRFATLTIDGASADLNYTPGGPSELNTNPGAPTLTIAGTEYDLNEGPVPSSASYRCLAQ